MNKKLLVTILPLLSMIVLSGCGNRSDSSESNTNESQDSSLAQMEGWNSIIDENGNEFDGQFVEGLYEGYGTMQYINGDRYEGTWVAGMKEGHGQMVFSTACLYVGEWSNDQMHGSGYMRWPMGDYYYGEWKNGNPNGFGTKAFLRDPTGASVQTSYDIYSGEMANGNLDGYGVMMYFFGGIFKGTFVNNTRVGYGVYYWEETDNPDIIWLKFEGNFSTRYDGSGWIDGEGTMYYKDGHSVTGIFQGIDLVAN